MRIWCSFTRTDWIRTRGWGHLKVKQSFKRSFKIKYNNTFWTCLCCCTVCWTEILKWSLRTVLQIKSFRCSFFLSIKNIFFCLFEVFIANLHSTLTKSKKTGFWADGLKHIFLAGGPGADVFYQTLISAPESSSFDWMYSSKLTSSDKVMRLVWI